MSILSDRSILEAMDQYGIGNRDKSIHIAPFNRMYLGSNSYDVHLGKNVIVYTDNELDCAREPTIKNFEIPTTGWVLQPNEGYLMVTQEYTETYGYIPMLEGKSSLGRLFMAIHVTAGKGDDGFRGAWTMEVTVKKPTRVYVGMPCGQLIYHSMTTPANIPYNAKSSAKYNNNPSPDGDHIPMPSRMYKNFPKLEK